MSQSDLGVVGTVLPLLDYLQQHFYHEQQLLDKAAICQAKLQQLQNDNVFPQASYQLQVHTHCRSFVTEARLAEHICFYPKSMLNWLTILEQLPTPEQAFGYFCQQYQQQLSDLRALGLSSDNPCFNQALPEHLEHEWQHFLAGTYGLCTKTGLPVDIASKELSMDIIKTLLPLPTRCDTQQKTLEKARQVFAQSCADFAPHELPLSSRKLYL